jgi:hypothetical protein
MFLLIIKIPQHILTCRTSVKSSKFVFPYRLKSYSTLNRKKPDFPSESGERMTKPILSEEWLLGFQQLFPKDQYIYPFLIDGSITLNFRDLPFYAPVFFSLFIYSVFQGFRQAKSANGGLILSSSLFLIMPQLPQKKKLASKVAKVNSKIIISLPTI